MNKAIFLDKDGTLIPDIPYNTNPDLIALEQGVAAGLSKLKDHQYLFVIISNQPGIAHGYFNEDALVPVQDKIKQLLQPYGIVISGFYYCPHFPNGQNKAYNVNCLCRKPEPGLLLRAARDLNIDLSQSWMIGDILNDVEAGKRAGCSTVLINNGNETEWLINDYRIPDYEAPDFNEAAHFISNGMEKTSIKRNDEKRLASM